MEGKDGMTLLYVPAGQFTMGSNSGSSNERPAHMVKLDAFWIDQTEVTNAMYTRCVQDGKCNQPTNTSHYEDSNYASHPVIYVSWNDAKSYCSWADRRLPSEAEWEKAARGADARVYPWGNDPPNENLLNFNNAVGDTTEAGKYSKGASPYGALDMVGNVSEWVADWYRESYYGRSPASNPLGPDQGSAHVIRGGSWADKYIHFCYIWNGNYQCYSGPHVTSLTRRWDSPQVNNRYYGFRRAMSATP